MVRVGEMKLWLAEFSENEYVGIDDGGLCLRLVGYPECYYEIGGIPEEAESEEVKNE